MTDLLDVFTRLVALGCAIWGLVLQVRMIFGEAPSDWTVASIAALGLTWGGLAYAFRRVRENG